MAREEAQPKLRRSGTAPTPPACFWGWDPVLRLTLSLLPFQLCPDLAWAKTSRGSDLWSQEERGKEGPAQLGAQVRRAAARACRFPPPLACTLNLGKESGWLMCWGAGNFGRVPRAGKQVVVRWWGHQGWWCRSCA